MKERGSVEQGKGRKGEVTNKGSVGEGSEEHGKWSVHLCGTGEGQERDSEE